MTDFGYERPYNRPPWERVVFSGRIEVGSVPGMTNKEVLAKFIYKPA